MNTSKLKPTPKAGGASDVPAVLSALPSADELPKIKLPKPGRGVPFDRVAALLADILKDRGFYNCRGVLERLEGGTLRIYTADELAALLNSWISWVEIGKNDGETESAGLTGKLVPLLALSPTLLDRLPKIETLVHVSVPVLRKSGQLEWLPDGLDKESGLLNLCSCRYRDDMSLDDAIKVMDSVFDGLPIHYKDEAAKVVRARLLALFVSSYAAFLIPKGANRLLVVVSGNRPGTGKSETVRLAVFVVNGLGENDESGENASSEFSAKLGGGHQEEKDLKKIFDSVTLQGRRFVLLDNIRDPINSTVLGNFVTRPDHDVIPFYSQRAISLTKVCQVFLTVNHLKLGEDFQGGRRLLEIPLRSKYVESSHPAVSDSVRKSKRELQRLRPEILAALRAIVGNWNAKDRPKGRKSEPSFEDYCGIVGGIVEAAVGVNPFDRIPTDSSSDKSGDRAALFREVLADSRKSWTIGELRELAQKNGLFEDIVTESLETKDKSSEGKRLAEKLGFNRLVDLEEPAVFDVPDLGEVHVQRLGSGRSDRPGGVHYVITKP